MKLKNTFLVFSILIISSLVSKAQLTANFSADKFSGCAPLLVNFLDASTSTNPIISRKWYFGNGNVNDANKTDPSASYITSGTYTVSLVISDGISKDSVAKVAYITVFANPVADFSTSNATTGCAPYNINFTNQTTLGSAAITNFVWSFDDGNTSTLQNPGNTYTNSGVYNITLQVTDANGCKSNKVKSNFITIHPIPVVNFNSNGPAGACSPPLTVTFNNSSTGTGSLTYLWDFGNGSTSTNLNPSATYNTLGKFDVSLTVTDQNECINVLTNPEFVSIGSTITSSFTPTKTTACPWEAINFNNTSLGATEYLWNFGDGTTSTLASPSHQFPSGGTYTVKLYASFNGACPDSSTTVITIESLTADFDSDPNTSCDVPFVVSYTDLSTNAVQWNWNFGTGSSSSVQNPTNAVTIAGSYTDRLIITSAAGCIDTLIKVNNINVSPIVPKFNVDVTKGCAPLTINFTDATVSSSPLVSFDYSFGDGNTSSNQDDINIYQVAGVWPVTYTVTDVNGCIATFRDTVRSGDKPSADFSRDPQIACAEAPVLFFDNSTPANLVNEWRWSFGDGASATEQDPIHLYQDTGNFSITIFVAINGCWDSLTKDTNVLILGPISTFFAEFDCSSPFVYTFKSAIIDATRMYWNFGDGSPLDSVNINPVHTYTTSGDYPVVLTTYNDGNSDGVRDTCSYVFSSTARIRNIQSNFTSNKTKACDFESILFDASTSQDAHINAGNASGYEWYFGDNKSPTLTYNPTISYFFTQNGTYTVRLVVSDINGCKDTSYQQVKIYKPNANYVADTLYGCTPLTVNFSDLSTGDTLLTRWNWDFGDGTFSSVQNPSKVYTVRGNKSVILIVTDSLGCKDTISKLNYIYPMKPIPSFSSSTKLCRNNTVNFSNSSQGDGLSFNWLFGDGSNSTLMHPPHIYTDTGYFNITLTATDSVGCDSTRVFSNYIHVQDIPTANFTSNITEGDCYPLLIQFQDLSVSPYINSWIWNFGDGPQNVTLQNPGHTYLFLGQYDVRLTVVTNYGCTNTIVKPKFINVKGPYADFTVNPDTVCQGKPVTFTITNDSNVGDFVWDFGDGNLGNGNPVVYSYMQTGPIIPRLLYNDTTNTCPQIAKDSTYVYDAKANFTSDKSLGCGPLSITFSNTSYDGTYFWNFGNGETSTQKSPVHIFTNTGIVDSIYTVKLVVTTPFGCKDSSSMLIRVYAPAIPTFTATKDSGCVTYPVQFTNLATNQLSYTWSFGDGTTNTSQNPSHTYTNASDTLQSLVAWLMTQTIDGCRDSTFLPITVFPYPNFKITAAPDSGCANLLVNFQPVSGAINSNWDFGDASTSTNAAPSHEFKNSTTSNINYTVKFFGTSQYGCSDTAYSTIKVFYKPISQFTLGAAGACTPAKVSIINSSVGATKFNWNYGDGNSLDTSGYNHSYTFSNTSNNPVTNTVRLIAESIHGCTDTSFNTITINPSIIANFITDTVICTDSSISFQNTSIGSGTNPNNYLWDLGNGIKFPGFEPSPVLLTTTGIKDTVYKITLIAISSFNISCKDTIQKTVRVKFKPATQFNTSVASGCTPLLLNLQNTTSGASTYQWNYGDGTGSNTTTSNHTHAFVNATNAPVNFNIQLIATSLEGCSRSIEKTITVFQKVTAAFSPVSGGCAPVTNSFLNQSTPASSLTWNFGNGNSSNLTFPPSQQFVNTTVNSISYTINLNATLNGCSHDTSQTITILPVPKAGFTPSPISQTFPSSTVIISNTSTVNNAWSYNWNFGDGNSASMLNPLPNNYSTWGDYVIKLEINTGSCMDTISRIIRILPPPAIPSFTPVPASGCEPLTVSFQSTSQYVLPNSYKWEFGDGKTSNSQNPTHTYEKGGLFSITLTVKGHDSITRSVIHSNVISVFNRAKPKFSFNPEKFLIPSDNPIIFVNESSFANNFFWDFGDEKTSSLSNPNYAYQDTGVYLIKLLANNSNNCPDSTFRKIIVKLRGLIDFPNAFNPSQYGTSGGYYDINDINNQIFFPKGQTIIDYHLLIFNRWGELVFETFDLKQGWDGYYRGNLCPQDVYVWKVQVKFEDEPDVPFIKAGDVTLLR